MSLDNLNQVDSIGINRESGAVVLALLDYWDWEDEGRHLLALQEKLNTYFRFVESGEIYESYPKAQGRRLVIEVVGKHILPPMAEELLKEAARVAEQIDVAVNSRHAPHPDS